jgi:hypothetical protein
MKRKRLRVSIPNSDDPPRKRLKVLKLDIPVRIGTNSILSDKIIADFCKLIRQGLPADGVCDYLGINPATYYHWLAKGKLYEAGDEEPKEFAVYGKFVRAFRKATAAYRLKVTRGAHRDSNYWVRDVTILERRDRKTWGKNEPPGGSEEERDPDDSFL